MTWKYTPVLNACIQVLLTVLLGTVMAKLEIFQPNFVPAATRFVFFVALPCLVIRGIGINVDFYSDAFIWEYIFSFLTLRAIALVLCYGSVVVQRIKSPGSVGIGHVAVRWLSMTWISTVIMGIPILTALTGSPAKGGFYGLLAGISSFIFQLPLQLCFLECHVLEREERKINSPRNEASSDQDVEAVTPNESCHESLEQSPDASLETDGPEEFDTIELEGKTDKHVVEVPTNGGSAFMLSKRTLNWHIWKKIFSKLARNPVLWGIFLGFLLSLTTVGKTYLKPGGEDFVEGLAWINLTLAWLGACVSPLSLFTMGVWMHGQGRQLFAIGLRDISLFMLSKLVLVPLVMVGLAYAFNLDDQVGRAAVLIASLPISLASFTVGEQYNIGEAVLSANVAVGTFLMLPTVILWNIVMDELSIFPNYK